MLKTIPVEDFELFYQKWEQRLHRWVAAQGNYFEGDNIDVWKKIKSFISFLPHLVYSDFSQGYSTSESLRSFGIATIIFESLKRQDNTVDSHFHLWGGAKNWDYCLSIN